MNQILCTKIKNNKKSNKKFFKVQFILSIITIIILIGFIAYTSYSLQNKERLSDNLIGNYNIYKLYADVSNNNNESSNKDTQENNLFGIIEIPKINLYYPIFSSLSEDNLKISPCKFYGDSLTKNDNICIAGHNYNNNMFFSKINLLSPNDEIFIYDNLGYKYTYIVFENYEVKEDDLSPIYNYDKNIKELTLITCNNLNNNRFVIKAKQTS